MRKSLFHYAPGRAACPPLLQQSICPRFASTMAHGAVASTSKQTQSAEERQPKVVLPSTKVIHPVAKVNASAIPVKRSYHPEDLLHFSTEVPREALLSLWPVCLQMRRSALVCALIRRLQSKRAKALPPASLQHLHQSIDLIRFEANPVTRAAASLLIAKLTASQIKHHQEAALGILRRCLSVLKRSPPPLDIKAQLQTFTWQLSKRSDLNQTSLLPRSKRDRARFSPQRKQQQSSSLAPISPNSLIAQRQFNLRLAHALHSRKGFHRSLRLLQHLAFKLHHRPGGFHSGNSIAANMVAKVALRNPQWASAHLWQFLQEGLQVRIRSIGTAQEVHDLLVFVRMVADAFGERGDGFARKEVQRLIDQFREALA